MIKERRDIDGHTMQALRTLQQTAGATLGETGIPTSFGNDAAAFTAAQESAALIDRSHWGVIELSGDDRLRFIHNQTTNAFQQRQPGEGCDTVFVTSTARTIDLVTAYMTEDAVLLVTSPGQDQRLMDWMDRYIFPADKVALKNLTATVAVFSVVGPGSETLLGKCGIALESAAAYGHHHQVELDGVEVRVAKGGGLASEGYTLLVPADGADTVWAALTATGAVPAGETVWNRLRIQAGRPQPGTELTEDYNPLEAGLWHSISFEKGCYIGQETIARLNTYQGVKQQLWGIQLSAPVEPGSPIQVDDDKVGTITSILATADGPIALGYIRTKAGGAGLQVTVGEAKGTVVDVPFLARGYLAE
jgi:folate-binding protein YgfZ